MRIRPFRELAISGIVFLLCPTASAQPTIPIRELSRPVSASTSDFANIFSVREVSSGKVFVNDGRSRQLLMHDAALGNRTVVLDSVPTNGQGYGPRASPMLAYLGDSTLFVDGASRTLLVLGPAGNIVRVASAPKPNDLSVLSYETGGIDARGNLVYRVQPRVDGIAYNPTRTDTAMIVRANFETRTVDTLARVKLPNGVVQTDTFVNERSIVTRVITPLNIVDEWTILSNGTIAIVRGHDYHVDFVRTDGTNSSGAKLPFDWKRLSDADKQALMDSAKAVYDAEEKDTTRVPDLVSARALMAAQNAGPKLSRNSGPKMIKLVAPMKNIPDYWPPIRSGSVKADRDNNLWILPTTTAQSKTGELVYDVVNDKGVMFQRVRVPAGRSIAGFGKNGVVYLMYRNTNGRWLLEKTQISAM